MIQVRGRAVVANGGRKGKTKRISSSVSSGPPGSERCCCAAVWGWIQPKEEKRALVTVSTQVSVKCVPNPSSIREKKEKEKKKKAIWKLEWKYGN